VCGAQVRFSCALGFCSDIQDYR